MRSVLGNIEVGSSLGIPTLLPKLAPSSIYTSALGRALHWEWMTTSFRRTRKPASKPDAGNIRLLPPASDRPMRVEHEYFREGAWTYLAAWDVHRAKVFGR